MKKTILSITLVLGLGAAVQAQDDKYTKAMEPKVAAVDSTRNPTDLLALAAAFERIAEAEKTKWQPWYYAALAQTNAGYTLGMDKPSPAKMDPLADKAEALLNKAEELSPNNSEIFVVRKMIATLRMMADPMSRFMQYGPKAEEALQKAMALNAENPRVYLLMAQDKFFTPEQFGGSKAEAKALFETAQKKYEAFKPASSVDPHWGRGQVGYFLGQMK